MGAYKIRIVAGIEAGQHVDGDHDSRIGADTRCAVLNATAVQNGCETRYAVDTKSGMKRATLNEVDRAAIEALPQRSASCTICGKPSIPGLLRGAGKCQYHYNVGQFGKAHADSVADQANTEPQATGGHIAMSINAAQQVRAAAIAVNSKTADAQLCTLRELVLTMRAARHAFNEFEEVMPSACGASNASHTNTAFAYITGIAEAGEVVTARDVQNILAILQGE